MQQRPDPAVGLHRDDPLKLVRRLKAEDGMGIWLCGGSRLAAAVFTEIDQLILKINPVLIGTGIPLFDGFEGGGVPAALIEHKVYANGFVLAQYDLHHSA
jgi:dihydrofolate reductase